MPVIEGAIPLEVGTVVAFTGEGIVTVVVSSLKSVAEMVPSL